MLTIFFDFFFNIPTTNISTSVNTKCFVMDYIDALVKNVRHDRQKVQTSNPSSAARKRTILPSVRNWDANRPSA